MSENNTESIENYSLVTEYTVPYETFDKAFVEFQKKFAYPKLYLQSAVFALIAIVYAFALIKDPTQALCYMLILICIGAIAFMWFNQKRIRKSLMESIKELGEDRYVATLYDEYMLIGTVFEIPVKKESNEGKDDEFLPDVAGEEIAQTKINFGYGAVKVLEKEEFFIVYILRKTFYVIPKKHLSDDEINIFREKFSQKLGKDFTTLEK